MSERILEVNDMHFNYGEIKAVKGITFHVEKGEIVTLIGSNGAGKTTTLSAISGLIGEPASGEIRFMGEKINKMQSHKVASLGIAHSLEGRHIFSQLTVMENLMMGAYLRNDKGIKEDLEYVFHLFPRLKERETQHGGTLSGGEQQMLAVGRALMQKPKILLMDEPSLGLAPLLVETIFKAIETINKDGIPILLVEQNCNAALKVADRGYVLETGNIILKDSAEKLLDNEEVMNAYLGIA